MNTFVCFGMPSGEDPSEYTFLYAQYLSGPSGAVAFLVCVPQHLSMPHPWYYCWPLEIRVPYKYMER